MRKKWFHIALALLLTASMSACQSTDQGGAADMTQAQETSGETESAASGDMQATPEEEMTLEELVKAAQEEAASDKAGTFMVYSPTSRIEKALNAFAEEYGIQGEFYNESGQDLYTKLTTELEANVKDTADVALLQDSYLFQTQLQNYDYVVNYVPPYLTDVIKEQEQMPLVCYYYNKLFIYNNTDGGEGITNVWQLTEDKYNGKIFMKDISKESINKNFFAMLTSPSWAQKLEDAYKAYYGKDIVLDENCPNAGYQFVKNYLKNVRFGAGDGEIAAELADGNSENMGLIVYSKLRSDSVKQENLAVSAYEQTQPDCFSGFMYPIYLQMIKNTDRPYTAKLFIYFLMTEKGFKSAFQVKSSDIGTYSGNSTLPSLEGDKELEFWKDCLVLENTELITEAYANGVLDFITECTAQ